MNYQIRDPEAFKQRLAKELNPHQYKAVTSTGGPLLVLAGAGSGKTRVITYRIAYLIAVENLAPWNILAMTFTNKAAGEMRERVDHLLGTSLRGLWLGTFHSICARILRYEGKHIGISPRFTIYDTSDQSGLIKRIMTALGINQKEINPSLVLSSISNAKNRFERPEQFEETANDKKEKRIARIYQEYQKTLRDNNALDFDDLLIETVQLLTHSPDAGATYRKRFHHILVDEYQDTNTPQYLILRELAQGHNNICAVGDDDQSIYRWRGASIRNILEFEKDFSGVQVIRLEQNYRSTKNILAAADHLVKLNKGRHPKTLWTESEEGEKLGVVQLPDEISEAFWVINEAEKLHKEKKVPFGQIAIFYRTNFQSRLFEEECIKRGIPYRLVGNIAFYERKEIKDILAYCKLLLNPADQVSFQRVVNLPRRKLGTKSVQNLFNFAALLKTPILEAAKLVANEEYESNISRPARQNFAGFARLFNRWLSHAKDSTLAELINNIVTESGYRSMLEEDTIG